MLFRAIAARKTCNFRQEINLIPVLQELLLQNPLTIHFTNLSTKSDCCVSSIQDEKARKSG